MILSFEELSKIGLQVTLVDYKKPILPQISEAEILINGLGKIDKDVIDNCPRLKLVHQIGAGIHIKRFLLQIRLLQIIFR